MIFGDNQLNNKLRYTFSYDAILPLLETKIIGEKIGHCLIVKPMKTKSLQKISYQRMRECVYETLMTLELNIPPCNNLKKLSL